VLDDEEYLSWDELVEALTGDIESRLEDALQDLQSDDDVRYSGRHGGYARVDG
jgi:ribosomal protein L17